MSESVCPICLGQRFSDYRGRRQTQCDSCQSLERHRSFRLFMLGINSTYCNLILTTPVSPLRILDNVEDGLKIHRLDRLDLDVYTEQQIKSSVVFLENKIGFEELEQSQTKKLEVLIDGGALVAFTCHANCMEIKDRVLVNLLGGKIESYHFNQRELFGDEISDRCRLHLKSRKLSMNDIFYFTKYSPNTDILIQSCKPCEDVPNRVVT